MDPTYQRKEAAAKAASELMKTLGIKIKEELTDYELMIASQLVDPKSIPVTWTNIGGLSSLIKDIQDTVILPVKRKDLFSDSQLTQPPKGVLLYGPPGCGKTMIAKATAREAGCNFINLDLSILTDKWYGESQKLAGAVFSLAVKIQPCIVFIDEIDSFLRNRSVQDHEATAMMKSLFMTLWDGIVTDPQNVIIVMGATNRPRDLDPAIRRRMPAVFHIPLPSEAQREDILKLILSEESVADNVDLKKVASETEGFSGSDLRELCRAAALYRVRDFFEMHPSVSSKKTEDNSQINFTLSEDQEKSQDTLRPITMDDLLKSKEKMKETKVSVTQHSF